MAHRLKALFLLLAIGVILPAAGSPQRFCTIARLPLAAGKCCERKCPSCPGKDADPLKPGCIASVKLLPDGVGQDHFHVPVVQAVVLPPFILPPPVEASFPAILRPADRDRAPPDALPIYLAKRSMLL